MSYNQKVAAIAAGLFLIGATVIVFVLSRQPILNADAKARSRLFDVSGLKPKEAPPKPVVAPALPPSAITKKADAIDYGTVFEGGKFGVDGLSSTPPFTMKPDWTLVVQTRGKFSRVQAYREDLKLPGPKDATEELLMVFSGANMIDRMDVLDPPQSFKHDFQNGGKYRVVFTGNGVWKVTIHQGTGKLD